MAGRQLLNVPDSPVHARMLTSPDPVNTCANRCPSEPSSGDIPVAEKTLSNEYVASSTSVVFRVEARRNLSQIHLTLDEVPPVVVGTT